MWKIKKKLIKYDLIASEFVYRIQGENSSLLGVWESLVNNQAKNYNKEIRTTTNTEA